jgi:ribosomal protein S18 acetylase RimI-like enzyme
MDPHPQMKIRRYKKPDQTQVWNLHILALQSVPDLVYAGGSWETDLQDIEKSYLDNGGEFLVAELNGEILGMGAFRKISESCAEIKRMRVHPDHWRQGIGQSILTRLKQMAKEKGYTTLVLDTTIHQVAAQGLYLKNGYTELRRAKRGIFDTIFYEKPL